MHIRTLVARPIQRKWSRGPQLFSRSCDRCMRACLARACDRSESEKFSYFFGESMRSVHGTMRSVCKSEKNVCTFFGENMRSVRKCLLGNRVARSCLAGISQVPHHVITVLKYRAESLLNLHLRPFYINATHRCWKIQMFY